MIDLLIINFFFITRIFSGKSTAILVFKVAACYIQTTRNQVQAKELEETQNELAVNHIATVAD